MGYSSYSDDFYADRTAAKAAAGVPTFAHDHAVKTGTAARACHPSLVVLDKIRESRDSAAHPESTPIGVVFDQTGSMSSIPPRLQAQLPKLMGLLLRKNYVKDPQVCFGAIGDYTTGRYSSTDVGSEVAPLQIGQFESGIEMDDCMTNILLEGMGGGSNHESYQNALYYFAHRTSCDAWEKRGKKGYLFIIGDELPYKKASREELRALVRSDAQGDVSLESIISACLEKWHIFYVLPRGSANFSSKEVFKTWGDLIGPQNVLLLEDVNGICELIGQTVGLVEGTLDPDSMAADMKDLGTSDAIIAKTRAGLDELVKSTALTRVGTGTLPEKAKRSDSIERI